MNEQGDKLSDTIVKRIVCWFIVQVHRRVSGSFDRSRERHTETDETLGDSCDASQTPVGILFVVFVVVGVFFAAWRNRDGQHERSPRVGISEKTIETRGDGPIRPGSVRSDHHHLSKSSHNLPNSKTTTATAKQQQQQQNNSSNSNNNNHKVNPKASGHNTNTQTKKRRKIYIPTRNHEALCQVSHHDGHCRRCHDGIQRFVRRSSP